MKRAWGYLIAKKGKSFLLLAVFTAILIFVLSGLTIRSAAEKAAENAKNDIGATVTLSVNREKMMQEAQEKGTMPSPDKSDPITIDVVESIAKLDGVKSTLITASSVATKGTNIFPIASEDNSDSENGDMAGGPQFRANINGTDMSQVDFKVSGVNDMSLLSDFSDGTAKITDGRAITAKDKGSSNVVIETTLAQQNNLKVGDTFELKDTDGKAHKMKIVGIYETSAQADGMAAQISAMNPVNTIYASYTLATTLDSSRDADTVDSAIYNLTQPGQMEKFVKAAESKIDTDKFQVTSNDALYQQMLKPINNVSGFATNIVILVASAGAIILALIVILTIRERRYEIGVLMAMGESKGKIIGQFFVELFVIMLLAVGLSSASGNIIGNAVGNQLLNQQNQAQMTNQEENMVGPMGGQGSSNGAQKGGQPNISMRGSDPMNANAQSMEKIESMDVKIDASSMFALSGIALGIVIIAVLASSIGILRLHPKEILTNN